MRRDIIALLLLAASCGGAKVAQTSADAGPAPPPEWPPGTPGPDYNPPNGQCEGCGVCEPCRPDGDDCTWGPNCESGNCVDGKCAPQPLPYRSCYADDGCSTGEYCSCDAANTSFRDPDGGAPVGCFSGACAKRKYLDKPCIRDDVDGAAPDDCIPPMHCDPATSRCTTG